MDAEPGRRSAGLLQNVRDGVLLLRADLTCAYANPSAMRAVGGSGHVGRPLRDLAPAIVGTPLLDELESVARDRREANGVYFVPGADRWYDVRASPHEGELLVLFRDVTDARRAEAVDQIGHELLRATVGPDGRDPIRQVCELVLEAIGWDEVDVHGPDEAPAAEGPQGSAAPRRSVSVLLSDPVPGRSDGRAFVATFRCWTSDPGDGAHLLERVAPLLRATIDRLRRFTDLEVLFASASDGVVIARTDGWFESVNPAFSKILGWTQEEMLARPFAELVHPDDLPATDDEVGRLADGGSTFEFTNRYRYKDGGYRVLEWQAEVSSARDRIYSTARDVTERAATRSFEACQRVTLEMIASDRSLDEICATLGGGLMERHPGGPKAIVVAEEPGGDAATVWMSDGFDADVRDLVMANLAALAPRGEACVVLAAAALPEVLRLAGVETVSVASSHDRLGRTVATALSLSVAGSGPDPSARSLEVVAALASVAVEARRRRRSTERSEERFRLVSQVATDAIYDWDLTEDRIVWSRGLEDIVRGELPEVTDFAWWERGVHPDDRVAVVSGLLAAMERGDEAWEDEYRFARLDGSFGWVLDRGRFLRDPDGTTRRMVGGMSDRTVHRTHEEMRLRAQRVDSIGALASGIAHDLNNVLTPILMASELLLDEDADDGSVGMIHAAAKRGAALVRQILAFGRGMTAEGPARTVLDDVLLETGRLLEETLPGTVRFRVDVVDVGLVAAIDPTQLQQVLVNLVLNARDALAGRSGEVVVRVRRRSAEGRDLLVLEVVDDGPGLDARDHDTIFEPYVTSKQAGEGTGLGLPTARELVERAGGSMGVRSEPGRGATFWVELPLVDGVADDEDGWKDRVSLGDGSWVLLVEDEAAIRAIVEQALRSNGYQVLVAADGGEAVATLARRRLDVAAVLLDDDLPVLDGSAVVAGLRRLGVDAPVVGMTGRSDGGGVVAVADTVLRKPFSVEDLLAKVGEVVAVRADRASATVLGGSA